MEIVINIPKEDYEYLKSHNENGLYNAILNGTPLPKGHGRLVDVDVLAKDFSKCTCKCDCSFFTCPVFNQKVIIEADEENK